MKKWILFMSTVAFCAVLFTVILASSRDDGLPPGNRTPERIGNGSLHVTYAFVERDFGELCQNADIIADVTITSWLGDIPASVGRSTRTMFEAKVNHWIKGRDADSPEIINIIQSGSSLCTIEGYPLFQRENRMLLFLVDNEGVLSEIEKTSWYEIYYGENGTMDIQSDGDTEYLLDRMGYLTGEFMDVNTTALEPVDSGVQKTLRQQMKATDPTVYESAYREQEFQQNIFRYEDFVTLIHAELKKGTDTP